MLMGEGKTTVIAPLLVLLLADTNRSGHVDVRFALFVGRSGDATAMLLWCGFTESFQVYMFQAGSDHILQLASDVSFADPKSSPPSCLPRGVRLQVGMFLYAISIA